MAESARRTVLVVEDDAGIRELLHLHLDLAGFSIDEVADGREALDRTRATPFDLVLLDVMLPGLDGVSVCRAIRSAGQNVDMPILMLTARDGERVHANEPYVAHKGQRLLNSRDMIFREGATQLVLPVIEAEDGYEATYRIAMRPGAHDGSRSGGLDGRENRGASVVSRTDGSWFPWSYPLFGARIRNPVCRNEA